MKKYHGIELKEVTEKQIFDPPKEMLVWDDEPSGVYKRFVCAIASKCLEYPVLITGGGSYRHCAEIPKPTFATHRELARWLAEGKGQYRMILTTASSFTYANEDENKSVNELLAVRKWSDTEWHKPTREYLGSED